MYTVWRVSGEERLQIGLCSNPQDAARIIEKDKEVFVRPGLRWEAIKGEK